MAGNEYGKGHGKGQAGGAQGGPPWDPARMMNELRNAVNESINGVEGRVMARLAALQSDIMELDRRLFKGNGDSLATQVSLLKQKVDEDRDRELRHERRLWGIIMAGVGLVSSLLGVLIQHVVIGG